MLKLENGMDFKVEHTSTIDAPLLQLASQNEALKSVNWEAQPTNGKINLGPFEVEYELHINFQNPVDSSFHVKISAQIPWIGKTTLINGTLDKNHATIGFDKYGFKALVKFDLSDMSLKVTLGAFGKTWSYTIWQL